MNYHELPRPTANILRLCDEIGYGHLTNLEVSAGQIHTTTDTRKYTSVNLDKAQARSLRPIGHDYTLNTFQERLVLQAMNRQNGRITRLDIRDGRPVTAHFEEMVAAI